METLFKITSKQVNTEEVHPFVQDQMKKYPVLLINMAFHDKIVIERIGPNKYKVFRMGTDPDVPRGQKV